MAVMPGRKKVRTSLESGERRKALVHLADRPLWDGELHRAVLGAADRVAFVAQFVECLVVDRPRTAPLARHTLDGVLAASGKAEARPGDQVDDDARDEHLAAPAACARTSGRR